MSERFVADGRLRLSGLLETRYRTGMTPSLPEGKASRCKLVREFAGSDVEPDLRVVIAILMAQRSVNDRLCSLAGAVLRGRPQVGIGVERCGGLRVPERALDGDEVAACSDEAGCVTVA